MFVARRRQLAGHVEDKQGRVRVEDGAPRDPVRATDPDSGDQSGDRPFRL